MASKDRRDEIVELQNELIRNRSRQDLKNVREDLWGFNPLTVRPILPDNAGPARPAEPTTPQPPQPKARPTEPSQPVSRPRYTVSGLGGYHMNDTTDDLMRMIRESADSLRRMTEDLNRGAGRGTGALPDIPLDPAPVLNSDVNKKAGGKTEQADAAAAAAPEEPQEEEPEKIEDLKAELNGYIGLDTIKREVESLINYVTVMQRRKEAGLPTPDMSLHMVFSGNPGTGKTMIARFMARVYRSLGILSKGHLVETDRSGLVAGYVGQTAIKTKEVIDKAKGGVLFIDEAYSLTNRGGGQDFGQEAVDTLLKAMEDMRDDLIVIVAGYTELMKQFVYSNPGLKSRFNRFMEFPDYSVDEMLSIFDMRCEKAGYRLRDDEAREALRQTIIEERAKDADGFGNARGVRNLFERALSRQADRLAALPSITREDLESLTAQDITGKAPAPEKADTDGTEAEGSAQEAVEEKAPETEAADGMKEPAALEDTKEGPDGEQAD